MDSFYEVFTPLDTSNKQKLEASNALKRKKNFTDDGKCKRCGGQSMIQYNYIQVCTKCGHAVDYSGTWGHPILRCPKHYNGCPGEHDILSVGSTNDGACHQTFPCGMKVNFD